MNDKLFYVDISRNLSISYQDFFHDLSSDEDYNSICESPDIYILLRSLAHSIINDQALTIIDRLDSNQPSNIIDKQFFSSNDRSIDVRSKLDSINRDLLNLRNWSLSLYSSGTTGSPKKITHDITTISKGLKVSDKHRNDVWGLAYNPSHIAGVQVFLQAFLNGNTIIRLFNLDNKQVSETMSENKVTHISATPTFYRLMLPSLNDPHQSMIRVTAGGEKLNQELRDQLATTFSNAKLTNVYASTELGSLLASENETFCINKKDNGKIKIDDGQLYVNSKELASIHSSTSIENWYATGDLVEIISKNPTTFKFIGRTGDLVNVGGYNVNLSSIEDSLLEIENVIDARVFAQKSSLIGNLICADVVVQNETIETGEITEYLNKKHHDHEIPRIIKFVDKIEHTRTGKKART